MRRPVQGKKATKVAHGPRVSREGTIPARLYRPVQGKKATEVGMLLKRLACCVAGWEVYKGNDRMDARLQELRERIRDAEMVLVGLGEEFQYDWNALLQDARYREIECETGDDKRYVWIVPFLQKMILRRGWDERWARAYRSLKELLADKNYFVVSLCIDDYLYGAGLNEEKIVTPCGGFRKMQCDKNCAGELTKMPEESYRNVLQYYRGEISLDALKEPVCERCGEKLRFNQLGVMRYAEEGYLKQWQSYTKWLQGTVNKQLCVLELGAGMAYPGIIRFPFEKIVYYNRKAFLYRVHPQLYQMGEEIADRSSGIAENPVDFLGRLLFSGEDFQKGIC